MILKLLFAFAPIGLAIQTLPQMGSDDVGNSLARRLQGENEELEINSTEGNGVDQTAHPTTLPAPVPMNRHREHTEQGQIIDGDMMVGEILQKFLNDGEARRRGVVSWDLLKWKDGTVPYFYDEEYPEQYKRYVRQAMDELETRAHPQKKCVRFLEDTKEKHMVKILSNPDKSCYSMLGHDHFYGIFYDGKIDREQGMNLHQYCFDRSLSIVKHELLHALGMIHEQSRMDRDEYIDIQWDNIKDGQEDQFWKVPVIIDTADQTYDYDSIMHYDAYAFTKNGKKTIVTKDPSAQNKIGMGHDLSESDVVELRRAYDCPVISEQNCECEKTWSMDGVEVANYCGHPSLTLKNSLGANYCKRADSSCGTETYQKCNDLDSKGLWTDGSLCGLGTTCNNCMHTATYWYGKAMTACGQEPKWDNGSICALGTSCNACKHEATYWWGKAFTACGEEPKWGNGAVCGLGTTCKACKNEATYWYGKAFTACGEEPKWDDGTRCLAGTTCKACKNGYSWWWSKFGDHCGKEDCWAPGTTCGRGTTCESRCCNGRFRYEWYWFGFGECTK